ncbi:sensor histidine kinase [Sorangium sp. So ce1128]
MPHPCTGRRLGDRSGSRDRGATADRDERPTVIAGVLLVARPRITPTLRAAHQPVRIVADADGGVARLAVSDQGIGISEPDQRRVFEAFERATGLHQAQSLGLGLYLVREIVRAHGGGVHLHSRPGSGTTFIVELPIEPGDEIGLAQPS